MNRRSAVASLLAIALVGRFGDPQPPPECLASSYDFIGMSTFAALRLDTATPVPPPNPERLAMIWVTHDLLPYDRGEVGGPVEMTRMMCYEFSDGTGGTDWPVDAAWQPPGVDSGIVDEANSADPLPLPLLAIVTLGVVLTAAAFVALRRRG